MSNICFEFTVKIPNTRTYEIFQDRIPEIIETIPIVNHTEQNLLSSNSVESIEDHWNISVQEVLPGIISGFIDMNDIEIRTESHWNESSKHIDFTLEAINWQTLLESCNGTIDLVDSGAETLIKVTCNYEISLSQIPGLPGFLATRLSKKLDSIAETRVKDYIPTIKNAILKSQQLKQSSPTHSSTEN